MRTFLGLLTIALLAASPLALAQEDAPAEDPPKEPSKRPDDAAWRDDCPPEEYCVYKNDDPQAYGDEGCIECSGPVDDPQPYGEEGCIECSGPIDNGSTCMDGQQEGETCDPNVYYMDGPSRGPSDGSCENCRGDTETVKQSDDTTAKAVPGPAVALGILAAAGAALLVLPRRK